MTAHLLQVFDNPLDPEIQPVSFVSEDTDGDLSVTRDLSVGRDLTVTRNAVVTGNTSTGSLNVTSGNAEIGSGDLTVTAGKTSTGSLIVTSGNAEIFSGDLTVTAGNLNVVAGNAVFKAMALEAGTPSGTGAAIPDAAGGATVDAEARAAINALLSQLRGKGFIAP